MSSAIEGSRGKQPFRAATQNPDGVGGWTPASAGVVIDYTMN
jgi:hypothetical protein